MTAIQQSAVRNATIALERDDHDSAFLAICSLKKESLVKAAEQLGCCAIYNTRTKRELCDRIREQLPYLTKEGREKARRRFENCGVISQLRHHLRSALDNLRWHPGMLLIDAPEGCTLEESQRLYAERIAVLVSRLDDSGESEAIRQEAVQAGYVN